MPFHRHVGKIKSTSQRCLVVFRQVPDEPDSCLVAITDQLPDRYHTDIVNGVESISAQQELEFAAYAARTPLSSGENMLSWLHGQGRLQKISTDDVTMLPAPNQTISLTELNEHLDSIKKENEPAEKATVPETRSQKGTGSALGDSQIAKNLLTQAITYEKEVLRLREQAYEIAPNLNPDKKSKPKSTRKSPAKKAKE